MTKLSAPLREQLTERLDELRVQRIWNSVRARRTGSLFAKRRGVPRWSLAVAAALAVLLAVGWYQRAVKAPLPVANGPLVSRGGVAFSTLGGERATDNQLSDGSFIRLDPGSRLEVLENTSKTFVSVLRSGRGAFAVQPGGPRRWTIEAGLLTVEVIGTRFSVARRAASVDVSVEHGVVLVRSELIADHVQRLTAGQQLSIRLPLAPTPESPAPAGSAAASVAAPAPSASVALPTSAPPVSLAALLELASDQRRRGDVQGAEMSLRRALQEHPSQPQAASVAFTLGKLLLDAAGRPEDAAHAFERCLASSPPSALAEDALFRLTEARARAGDRAGASASARQYQGRYPNGRHAHDVDRWLEP
jgi:transmembrane sensor